MSLDIPPLGGRALSRRIWFEFRYAPLSGGRAKTRRIWPELRYAALSGGRGYGLSFDTSPDRGPGPVKEDIV